MPEPLPLGFVCHKQYPGRKRRNNFASGLCIKKALQYQRPNFGAEFKNYAPLAFEVDRLLTRLAVKSSVTKHFHIVSQGLKSC
jgi:hypothetical protein